MPSHNQRTDVVPRLALMMSPIGVATVKPGAAAEMKAIAKETAILAALQLLVRGCWHGCFSLLHPQEVVCTECSFNLGVRFACNLSNTA